MKVFVFFGARYFKIQWLSLVDNKGQPLIPVDSPKTDRYPQFYKA